MESQIQSDLVAIESSDLAELSEDESDTVAGRMSLSLGSASQFFRRDVMMGQQTKPLRPPTVQAPAIFLHPMKLQVL
jgi:hypothetical protein